MKRIQYHNELLVKALNIKLAAMSTSQIKNNSFINKLSVSILRKLNEKNQKKILFL